MGSACCINTNQHAACEVHQYVKQTALTTLEQIRSMEVRQSHANYHTADKGNQSARKRKAVLTIMRQGRPIKVQEKIVLTTMRHDGLIKCNK